MNDFLSSTYSRTCTTTGLVIVFSPPEHHHAVLGCRGCQRVWCVPLRVHFDLVGTDRTWQAAYLHRLKISGAVHTAAMLPGRSVMLV
jgi:hypothetical protein